MRGGWSGQGLPNSLGYFILLRACARRLYHITPAYFASTWLGDCMFQARHDVVVGLPLVYRQLPPAVLQAVHPHVPVEAQLIRPVLALHFAVVARRCDLNAVIRNAHFQQGGLKSVLCFDLVASSAFVNSVPLSVWIIRIGNGALRTKFNRNARRCACCAPRTFPGMSSACIRPWP